MSPAAWLGPLILLGLAAAPSAGAARPGSPAPEISSETWLNSQPRRLADLKGKVVLVEFWTFGCYNCRHVEPYVKQWHERYGESGLVVIGVHSPEFSHEADLAGLKRYVTSSGIKHAVAVDNDFAIWNRYGNRYWPAIYLIDKAGLIRHVKIGEGDYEETERIIKKLLAEKQAAR